MKSSLWVHMLNNVCFDLVGIEDDVTFIAS